MYLLSIRLMTSHPVSVVLPYFTCAHAHTHMLLSFGLSVLSFVSAVVYSSSYCLMPLQKRYFLLCTAHVYTTVPLISPVFLTAFQFVPILPDVCVLTFRTNYTHLYSSWYTNLTKSTKFISRCQNGQVICFRLYNVNTIMNFEFQKMWGIPWLACLCVFVTCRFIPLVLAMFYYFV
jgi:hypothetical protein